TLSVTIDNVHEAPVITSNGGGATGTVSVDENQKAVTTVTATDLDAGATLTYSVSGGTNSAAFSIDTSTGELTFISAPDFETKTSYEVVVTASDGTLTDVQTITVTVENVNEAPMITSDGSGTTTHISVDENQTAVTTVTAQDPDVGDSVTYTVTGGNDMNIAQIDKNTGALSLTVPANFENPEDSDQDGVYKIEVTSTDESGATDTQLLSIDVLDVNEAPLGISYTVIDNPSMPGYQTILLLSTDDEDSGENNHYEIVGGVDAEYFTLGGDSNDQLIPDQSFVNSITRQEYSVIIEVTDSEGLVYVQELNFQADDFNDNSAVQPLKNKAKTGISSSEIESAVNHTVIPDPDPQSQSEKNAATSQYIQESLTDVTEDINSDSSKFNHIPSYNLAALSEVQIYAALAPIHQAEVRASDNPGIDEPTQTSFINELLSAWAAKDQNKFSDLLAETKVTLYNDLDELSDSLSEAWKQNELSTRLNLEVLTGVSVTLSTLLITKMLQTGALLSGFLTTMPIWRQLDPLPILKSGIQEVDGDTNQRSTTTDAKSVAELDDLIHVAENQTGKKRT
ncbi:MAG: cadherin domain-containing protein, partial [Granulosicoccus sp.]